MQSNDCQGCRHAPSNWRDYSQLPTCTQPSHTSKPGGIWQIHNRTDCAWYQEGESKVVVLDTLYDHKTNRQLEDSIQYCKDRLAESIPTLGADHNVCRSHRLQIECEQRLLDSRV
mgnify:CR=1 FL=1